MPWIADVLIERRLTVGGGRERQLAPGVQIQGLLG
jgi:hypothetical protein